MIRKTFRSCVQLLGGLSAGLAIILLLIAWQFHKGPVSLSFLTPYVEQALNSNHKSFRLAIEDTTLTWAGWDRALEIRVKNVRAVGDDGAAVARIPELSLSLSGRALLRGVLAPEYIELLGPEIRVRRNNEGEFGIELVAEDGDSPQKVATGLVGWLIRKPEPDSPMSYLNTVKISGAIMTYEDLALGKVWDAPVGYLRLDRASHGLLAEGSLLLEIDDKIADLRITGSFHSEQRRIDTTVSFGDILPSSFSALVQELDPLKAIEVPLSGTVLVGLDLDQGVETVGFNVTGTRGLINLPIEGHAPLEAESLAIRGLYNGGSSVIQIDHADIDLKDATAITIPAPINHTFKLDAMKWVGRFGLETEKVEIDEFIVSSGETSLTLSAAVTKAADGSRNVAGKGKIIEVPVDQVTEFWPATLGTDAYTWITAHMKHGVLHHADAEFDFDVAADGALKVAKLDGTMAAEGVTVSYLPGMPAVKDVAALMAFDADTFDIAVDRGHSENLIVESGTMHISGLQEFDQFADLEMQISAKVPDALKYIDNEPLGFAREMGIDPASTKGDAVVDVKMRFLLAKDLSLDDVDVTAHADLKAVSMEDVVFDRDVTKGDLTLTVDKVKMDVSGVALMTDLPINLTWTENFDDTAPFRAQYEIGASIDDVEKIRSLGVDVSTLTDDIIKGGVDTTVRYTLFDERTGRVEIEADLVRSEMKLPMIDWRKAPGDSGWAAVTILIENGLIKSVPTFEVNAGDLMVEGDIQYAPAGLGLERINLKQVLLDRTNVSGAVISRPDGGWELGLQGSEIDITPLWDRMINDRPGRKKMNLPDLTVAIELDKVWVDKQRFMTDVSGTFAHRQEIWRSVLFDSKINGQSDFDVNILPDETGNRIMSVKAENAGDVMRFMDIFENMYGGKMTIQGRYDDAAPDRPLNGTVKVSNYRVRNAPVLTRVLSIMALTGIVDAMTGEGLNFSDLTVPFTHREGEIKISGAKATGTSIGFTASGNIYTHADVVNIEGTVVPAYAVNSLLGKIPLLGNLLTGTEDGGGIFAAKFSVSGPKEDPQTSVNPLSALTPGILRNIFGGLPDQDGQVQFDQPTAPADTPLFQ